MSDGANKRREVLKFEGDDINEYMDGCVNGVTHNEDSALAFTISGFFFEKSA